MTGGVDKLRGLGLTLIGLFLNIQKHKEKNGYNEFINKICSHSDLELEEFMNVLTIFDQKELADLKDDYQVEFSLYNDYMQLLCNNTYN